ncbi:MAG: iron-containing redox enzyme family protein [Mycobacteriaceae bacterium]
MPLPAPRGELSRLLLAALSGGDDAADFLAAVQGWTCDGNIFFDDDVQLTLTLLYELHLQGLAGVSDEWEWNSELLAARALLEQPFEGALRQLAPLQVPGDVEADLVELTSADGGPGLSRYMARTATLDQWQEFLTHRSIYQLREADPHTMGIPRLAGGPKAALVEVQADEYGGGGRPERMHSALFARTMRALGMDDSYAAHLDAVPAITLASVNALSLFAVHRRLLGALVGHLCAVEMTSSAPCKLYASGLRRLGFGTAATLFFDEHVEADAAHEQICRGDLAGGLAKQQPERATDILFGAAVCLGMDELGARHMMECWAVGDSSLREVTPPA